MGKTTMLELLVEVSDAVKDYWKEGKNGSFNMEDDNKNPYADKVVELMCKAAFDDEMEEHTDKDIAAKIDLVPSTFSKFKTASTNLIRGNFEKVLNPILGRLSAEGNLADDKMKKRVGELLFCIFRREVVKKITAGFTIQSDADQDEIDWKVVVQNHTRGHSHKLLVEKIFGSLEQTQDLSYGDFFVDGGVMEDEMGGYSGADMQFDEYRAEDDSKRYVAIFDVKHIYTESLHQRIRCLQRKDNVFAVLMVEKGACSDDEEFYQNEDSNIMLIEYKEVQEENSESCSYNYLRGICSSWYNEDCKAFMTKGIDKITVSHK